MRRIWITVLEPARVFDGTNTAAYRNRIKAMIAAGNANVRPAGNPVLAVSSGSV